MIKVERFRVDALDAALRAEMVALRNAQTLYDSPFFDLEFAAIVAKHRSDAWVIVAIDQAGLLGFWPMHIRPDKWARPIGGPFSDWHGPVMRDGETSLSPQDFLKQAGLKGMTANGLSPNGLTACAGGEVFACGIAQTAEGAESYRAKMRDLHPKHFKNLRRAERLIERDFGGFDIEIDDVSSDSFEWLMTTKRQQYLRTGKHDVLGPKWVQGMMADLLRARQSRLRARVSTLRLGDRLAAAEFNLLSDKVVHGWITAFDQEFAIYSPGHLLMLSVICDMEHTGHTICDIGADNHAYKRYYESYQIPVERTIIRTGIGGMRPLAACWCMAERTAPDRMGGTLASMRRRADQIFGSELETTGRIAGFVRAIKGKTRH